MVIHGMPMRDAAGPAISAMLSATRRSACHLPISSHRSPISGATNVRFARNCARPAWGRPWIRPKPSAICSSAPTGSECGASASIPCARRKGSRAWPVSTRTSWPAAWAACMSGTSGSRCPAKGGATKRTLTATTPEHSGHGFTRLGAGPVPHVATGHTDIGLRAIQGARLKIPPSDHSDEAHAGPGRAAGLDRAECDDEVADALHPAAAQKVEPATAGDDGQRSAGHFAQAG
jgi:hypothetical protein